MTKSLLLSSFTAASLALGLAACDEQQTSDSGSAVPMQQQGAMPSGEGADPQTQQPQTQQPQASGTLPMEPETTAPETEGSASGQ
ncbi:hypothetical protein AAFN88_19340 [Pelagibius sp. CAU 1746]|uniref:hypothetical protein n=1 Tax=Pelagibius sp. CAU 1746 TaxID=3140370 RepID=UPI00325A5FAD